MGSFLTLVISVVSVVILGGCAPKEGDLATSLPVMQRTLMADGGGDTLVLGYDILNHDGAWRHEIVVDARRYAERRTHVVTGRRYAFGEDAGGAWVSSDGVDARPAGEDWRREARTHAVLYGLRFLDTAGAEEAVYLPRSDGAWDYVFRAPGARAISFIVAGDLEHAEPRGWDTIDELGRLVTCDDVRWTEIGPRRRVPSEITCSCRTGRRGALTSRHRLDTAALVPFPPAWATPRHEPRARLAASR